MKNEKGLNFQVIIKKGFNVLTKICLFVFCE